MLISGVGEVGEEGGGGDGGRGGGGVKRCMVTDKYNNRLLQ